MYSLQTAHIWVLKTPLPSCSAFTSCTYFGIHNAAARLHCLHKLHIIADSRGCWPETQPSEAAHYWRFKRLHTGNTVFRSCSVLKIQEAAYRKHSLQKLLIIEDSRGCIPETQSSEAAHYLGFKTLLAGNTVFRICSLIQDAADRLHTAHVHCAAFVSCIIEDSSFFETALKKLLAVKNAIFTVFGS